MKKEPSSHEQASLKQSSQKQSVPMRSLADMPKPVLICEVIGIVLLVIVFLKINNYISLPIFLDHENSLMVMVFAGVGLLIPAALNIIWRAINGLSFLDTNTKGGSSKRKNHNVDDKDQNKDDKQ